MSSSDIEELGSDQTVTEGVELEAFTIIVQTLQKLGRDSRQRVLASAATFLGLSSTSKTTGATTSGSHPIVGFELPSQKPRFSEDRAPSPKEFMFEKRPSTDVERIACLAYYLTHYRDTAHFKTLDLSKLNTEAAQLKMGNPTQAMDNAAKAGLIAPSPTKGAKQLSALGEQYVQALPDKVAARAAIAHGRPKRRARRGTRLSSDPADSGEAT